MANHSKLDVRMELTDRFNLNSIVVPMESFFDFTFWLSEELDDLIATVQHSQNQSKVQPAEAAGHECCREDLSCDCEPFV